MSKKPKSFKGTQKEWDEAMVAVKDIVDKKEKSIYWDDFTKATKIYDEKTGGFNTKLMHLMFSLKSRLTA